MMPKERNFRHFVYDLVVAQHIISARSLSSVSLFLLLREAVVGLEAGSASGGVMDWDWCGVDP
jgi:hypothetical protein